MNEIIGVFGIDDNIEKYITGKLRIEDSGKAFLQLYGAFSESLHDSFLEIQNAIEYKVIKGYGNNGKYYEMLNCVSIGGKSNFSGLIMPEVNYACDFLVEYKSVEAKNANYVKVTAEIDKLNQWFRANNGWQLECPMNKDPYKLNFSAIRLWEKSYNNNLMYIGNGFSTNANENVDFSVTFTYSLGFEFEEEKISTDLINKHFNNCWDFANLLSVLINERAKINSFVFSNKDNTMSAKVYSCNISLIKNSIINAYNRLSMISFDCIKDNLCELYENYQIMKEALGGVINIVLDDSIMLKHRNIDVVDYSKQTATAIECFMRNMREITIEDNQSVYDERIESVLSSQSEENKKWLQEKLKYSNNASLRKQLTLLTEEFNENFNELSNGLFSNKKLNKLLIGQFVDTRNFYTHYDLATKKNIMENNMLVYYCDLIKEFLRLIMLKEFGISLNVIKKASRNNQTIINCKNKILEILGENND